MLGKGTGVFEGDGSVGQVRGMDMGAGALSEDVIVLAFICRDQEKQGLGPE